MIKAFIALLFSLLFIPVTSFAQHIEVLQQGKSTSIRGLSVVDDSVAWISGSKGTIAITTNGGKTWNWQQVKGFEKADFRDIEAFSAKEAIIMSSGTPALILKTIDGGASWQEKYQNADKAYFFDAMDFVDKKRGYVLGDPISGKFVLMETKDGGETWLPFKNPPDALPGEAAFAASGTCLRLKEDNIIIVTGGAYARKLTLLNNNSSTDKWIIRDLEIKHGKPSQGAFSIFPGGCEVVVGGDYEKALLTDSVAQYRCYDGTDNSGLTNLSKTQPSGYQSCVEYIQDEIFISTGTPGSNITKNGGKTWAKIDDASYNVCRRARHGKLVILAGDGGKIGIFKM